MNTEPASLANSKLFGSDARDFVARQLAHEFEAGATAAEGSSRLRNALPSNLHWAVAEVEGLFAGQLPRRAQPQLGAVLSAARESGAKAEVAFAAYQRCVRDSRFSLAEALSGARSFGVYMVGMSSVLAVVVCIYAIFVLPQFKTMFSLFGRRLPAFTETMLGNTWLLPLALLLLAVVLIGYFKGVTVIRRRLLGLEPLRPALRWVPGFAAWAQTYDAGLWMRYQAILLDAGASAGAARTAATNLAGEPAQFDRRVQLLESAAQLGRLRQELGEQIARADQESLDYFESPRNSLVLAIRALIYLLLGSYIIAMYLPIFKLGAIV